MDQVWQTLFSGNSECDFKIAFKLPYTSALSKNRLFKGYRRGGGFFTPKDVIVTKETIKQKIKESLQGRVFVDNKIYVSIFVAKPNARGDAINVIDSLMDAIQDAIGVNDKWYSIQRLDWTISRLNPFIFVSIGQKNEPLESCRYCGRLLPLSFFTKNASRKNGVTQECKECLHLATKIMEDEVEKTAN